MTEKEEERKGVAELERTSNSTRVASPISMGARIQSVGLSRRPFGLSREKEAGVTETPV